MYVPYSVQYSIIQCPSIVITCTCMFLIVYNIQSYSVPPLLLHVLYVPYSVQYLIEWNSPYTHVSASRQSVTPDTVVLMDWYLNKQDINSTTLSTSLPNTSTPSSS